MNIITLLLLLVITDSVSAEDTDIYTCYTASKRVSFQATPCSSGENQNIVKIPKRSPEQTEAAQKELDKVTTERTRLDEIEQARRKEAADKWQAEEMQREVTAAKQAAETAKNDAAAARLEAERARQDAATSYLYPYPVRIHDNYDNRNRPHNSGNYDNRYNQRPIINPPRVSPFPEPYPVSPYPLGQPNSK